MSKKPSEVSPTIEPSSRLIGKSEVLRRVPFSDVTLWRRTKEGAFPAPVEISANRVAWREADVDQWIEGRKTRVG